MTVTEARPQAPHGPAVGRPTSMCIVVPQIGPGEGAAIARNLRRHGNRHAIVLARRGEPREVVALLAAGVRGAVATEPVREVPTTPPPVPRAPSTGGLSLTAREISVLALVAEGHSNRAIGEILDLSALTVKSHLARIARKLGTGDRAALVAVALRRGLI